MNKSKVNFLGFKVSRRERRELLLMALLLTTSMLILNSSFNKMAEETVIKVSEVRIEKDKKNSF
jgi:hypothetical protein